LTWSGNEKRHINLLPNIFAIMGLNPRAGEFIPRQLKAESPKPVRAIKGLILGPHDPTINTQAVSIGNGKRYVKTPGHSFSNLSKPSKQNKQSRRLAQHQGVSRGPYNPSISTYAMSETSENARRFGKHNKQPHGYTHCERVQQLRHERHTQKMAFSRHDKSQNHSKLHTINASQTRDEVRRGPIVKTRGRCVNLGQSEDARSQEVKLAPVVKTFGCCVNTGGQEDTSRKITLTGWFNPNSPYLPPERIIPPNPNKPFFVQKCCTRPNPNTRSQQLKPKLPTRRGVARPPRRARHLSRFPVSKRRNKSSQTPNPKRRNNIKGLVMGPYDPAIKTQANMNNRRKRRWNKRR